MRGTAGMRAGGLTFFRAGGGRKSFLAEGVSDVPSCTLLLRMHLMGFYGGWICAWVERSTTSDLTDLTSFQARPFVVFFQSQILPGLSTFDNNSEQNGSKNGETAPRPGTGYPHEGPSVVLGILTATRHYSRGQKKGVQMRLQVLYTSHAWVTRFIKGRRFATFTVKQKVISSSRTNKSHLVILCV